MVLLYSHTASNQRRWWWECPGNEAAACRYIMNITIHMVYDTSIQKSAVFQYGGGISDNFT